MVASPLDALSFSLCVDTASLADRDAVSRCNAAGANSGENQSAILRRSREIAALERLSRPGRAWILGPADA